MVHTFKSVLGEELCKLLGPDSMCCCMIAWSVYYKESNLPEILGKKKIQVSVNAILMQFQKMNVRWWNIIDMDHVGIRSLDGGDYVLFSSKHLK